MKLLVANRGEIAIRIMSAAAELHIPTVGIFSEDDNTALHIKKADEIHPLKGTGPGAYLDIEQIITAAKRYGCDAIHPGYGFLSENAGFAQACEKEGLVFVGPGPETLGIFGDKVRARNLAERCGVPVLKGIGPVTLDGAKAFMNTLGDGSAILIKAIAGGGGRGMRKVFSKDDLDEAYSRCRSEALQAFGNPGLYVEELLVRPRHIEVQIIGDGQGAVNQLGERDCSIQRQHQKLIEIAPCPVLPAALRDPIVSDAVAMAEAVKFRSAGTFEFLVREVEGNGKNPSDSVKPYAFIETNARLQVEHTVTEEVFGLDLVRIQLQLAQGKSLAALGLSRDRTPAPKGYAIQARVNMETMGGDGISQPSGGRLTLFESPSGRGIRVDSFGYAGYQPSPHFDSLLAKLIIHSSSEQFSDASARMYRALSEFRIEGVATNLSFLQSIVGHQDFISGRIHTTFVEDSISSLLEISRTNHSRLFFDAPVSSRQLAGAKVDETDPLAVLSYGERSGNGQYHSDHRIDWEEIDGIEVIKSPLQGTIIAINVNLGDQVIPNQALLVMNAMKMEHVVRAHTGGIVQQVLVNEGDTVYEGHPLFRIEKRDIDASDQRHDEPIDLDEIRPDLAEVKQRQETTRDGARPAAVAKRRKIGQRTARENIADLCDPGTYVEYGSLVIAAQRQRRTLDDLIQNTPADGMIGGIGSVNGDLFDDEKSRCMILSYDYMVLAGTQGHQNHRKKDRMFALAEKWRIPLIFFTEGGGGRPGDTDKTGVAGQDVMAFHLFARLSGLVPLIGINAGRCFAGNAAILGCCDVIIAKKNSSIGMGGPAMIEGGGLGVFTPEEVGPMSVQVPNGVVDIPVNDEAEAVDTAKKYLSYFQGKVDHWEAADQRLLRKLIPENRLRVYDIRAVIETLADRDSVLELRRHFAIGMITAFIRMEGRPLGVIANNPAHLSGAIDSPGADKAARFMKLCDAFDIPILYLSDTPGIMVGPEVEKSALVRHCARMFVTGANLTVPFFTIILRKSYGLGALAMQGGSSHIPLFTVSWPTGEFGGMGLEGQVKLGFRKELMAIEDPIERKNQFEKMVAVAYERGKAINMASHFEIDDVIDPADSRYIIVRGLKSVPPAPTRRGKKRPSIDTW